MTMINNNELVVKLNSDSTKNQAELVTGQGLEIGGRLVGKAAFTRFLEVLLDPRFRDAGRPGHLWLIVQGESPSFYRGTVSGDSYGSLTKLKDPKKPESRVEVGSYGQLYEMVASHAKKAGANGVTFIPSFPAWHPLKEHFRSSNIIPVEFDQIGLDEQRQLLDYLKTYGVTPAGVVHSASKSLHFYFLLDREVGEEQLTFIKNLFVPLGADPKPCRNVVNSYRLAGFYRASKDREQTLEYCVEDAATVVLSPDEFTCRLRAALEGKGHTTKSFEEHQAEARQKQERAASYEAADLGIYDGNDLQRLVNEVLTTLPPRSPGTGTYEQYRQIAKAFANLIGEETAIALMESHSPGETSWRQIITTSTGQFRFTAIIESMRYLVDPEWSLPDWFCEKYSQQTETQKDDNTKKCWQSWEDTKKLTPDIVTNQEFFEYPVLQKSKTIEFVKLRLGGGKTTNLRKRLIEYCQKTGVVSLGYRNLLLIQFGEHTDFKENKLGFYHINNDSQDIYFADPNLWLSSCVDSILKIPLDVFEDKIIILDEVNSIIKHLLFSSTIKRRPKVIQHFFEAIRRCDRVLAMDGHLADWVVDFFKGINTGKNIVTIENQFKAKKAPLTILEGTVTDDDILKANDRSPLIKKILAEKENFAVCSDSQTFLEAIDKRLTARGKKTLRIDSKTAKDVIEIIKGIDNYLKANPDTILLYSPSAESGLDISITGYFKKQFCLSFGVLDVDSSIQLYNRIRDVNCHKILWAAQFAKSDDPSDAKSYDAETLGWYQSQALTRDLHTVMSGEAGGLEAIANILKMVQESHGVDSKTANRLQGIRNFERANFRECLKRMLTLTGCNFETVCFAANDPEDFAARQELREATDEVKDKNAQDIFNAGDDFVGKFIPSTGDADWPTRCKIEKARLIERLPGINHSEFWNPTLIRRLRYDEPLLLTNLERYYLAQNLDVAKNLSIIEYQKLNQDAIAGEHFCLWKHRTDYSMVKALADLGLFELAESGETYTADHPTIKGIIKKCRTKPIQHSLRRSPGKDPMKFIGRLLRLIGLEWRRKTERLPDGRVENRYTVINPIKNDPLLTYLIECQAARLESKVNQYTAQKQSQNLSQSPHQKQWCGEGSQSLTTQGLEAVTLSANFYNKNTSEVLQDPSSTPFKPGDRVRCQGETWLLEVVAVNNTNATLRFLGIGDCESLIELETSYLIPEAAAHAS